MYQLSNNIEKIIEKIINVKDENSSQYIEKYNKNWVLSFLEEGTAIKMIEKSFQSYEVSNGVDIVDFITIFLTTIEHSEYETFYICISLIDLFKEICEYYQLINLIKLSDVLNYLVEVNHYLNDYWY